MILSGPVGAGKTTVARELVTCLAPPVAHIEGDQFWFFIAKGTGRRRDQNFKMIMTAMTAAAIPYALYGYQVILDFSIPPWFLNTAQRLLKAKEISLDYVVLRPSEEVCASRAANRSEGTITDYEHYRELYSSFDGAERHIIADDTADAATVAARIKQGLDVGKFRI